jgi:hypothetical protein
MVTASPAVLVEVFARLDIEQMSRMLSPEQVAAVMDGVAKIIKPQSAVVQLEMKAKPSSRYRQ